MGNRFTEKAELALNSAVYIAESFGHTYVGTEHVLMALLEDTTSCASAILSRNGVKTALLRRTITEYSGSGVRSRLSSKDTTPRLRHIVENSYKYSQKYCSPKIGTEHILIALLDERDSVALKLLRCINADISIIREELIAFLKMCEQENSAAKADDGAIANLLKYGKNLCAEYSRGSFDPLIGRENEVERIIRVLCRKNKNNPCLVGEAGVGKTAIVEGLAARIVENRVPMQLKDKKIILINLTSMVAGAKYRGDFEERIRSVIDEAVKNKSVVLFIDEIHTIVGAGAAEGAIDAANILKPYLARGELRLIGATTPDEYKRYIEKDSALERRFQPVFVKEPNAAECMDMIRGISPRFYEHYGIELTDNVIKKSVEWSSRYIKERHLPDKAIDVIDEVLAQAMIAKTNNKEHNSKQSVSEDTVAMIIKEMCGVDPRTVTSPGDSRRIENEILKSVFGQKEAVRGIVDAVVRSWAGIFTTERPKGVFLFLGESGVGKTELAKTLAKTLYSSSDSLVRFDMSEFSEGHSVSKFIGSPPGYVGFDDSRSVCEIIRKNRSCVVLFDEIEKSNPEVLNLLLQIFDNGKITDSAGRKIDFSDTYIIMTSNIGADNFKGQSISGFVGEKNDSRKVTEKLKKYFSTEFINRIDDIILFSSLDERALTDIARKEMKTLTDVLSEREYTLQIDEEVYVWLAKTENADGGARGVIRKIKRYIETPIAELIISNEATSPCKIEISIADDCVCINHHPLLSRV